MPKNFGINYHLQTRLAYFHVGALVTAFAGAHPLGRTGFILTTGSFRFVAQSGLVTPSNFLRNATTNLSGALLVPVTIPFFTRSAARLVVVYPFSTQQFAHNSLKSPKMLAYVSTEKSPFLNSPQLPLLHTHMMRTTLTR